MKTFILLTFGFLAFAFYEMSGGSDFEPASARLATAEPKEDVPVQMAQADPAEEPTPQAEATTAPINPINSTPNVTRVALNLTNASEAAEHATAEDATVAEEAVIEETPQIILPSLIAPSQDNNFTAANTDIRTVSSNRVNVRGGPSTNHGIVSKLTRGAVVQILEDNGDGWVRMKPVDGGESGWMADFLLTSG